MTHKWYAIQTYVGSEQSVKRAVTSMTIELGIASQVEELVVPTEDVIEMKNGKQKVIKTLMPLLTDNKDLIAYT